MRRIHLCVRLNYIATLEKVSSQRRRIAERLQCSVHVARVGNVLQPNQTTLVIVPVVAVVVAALVAALVERSDGRHLVRRDRVTASDRRATLVRGRRLLLLSLMRINVNEYLHFAHITPNATRRQIQLHTVHWIGAVVLGAMVLIVLGAADVEASFVQTDPEVFLQSHGALGAWQSLMTKTRAVWFLLGEYVIDSLLYVT